MAEPCEVNGSDMPPEKVDEWGWNLSRKERAAIKRRAAEKKAAANRGSATHTDEYGII